MSPETKRRLDAELCSYRVFRKTYEFDPQAFVHDCFDWPDGQHPTAYQDEILAGFVAAKRLAVRGPRGLGKSSVASWLLHWWALTRDGDDWKAATTAGRWSQLKQFLWPEVHKWARRIRWSKIGRPQYRKNEELLDHGMKLATGRAFASSPDRPAVAEGAQADRMLYIYDEAKTIEDAFFNATEGAGFGSRRDGREVLRLMISVPGVSRGRFYDIHARDSAHLNWTVRHVTMHEALTAGRMDPEDVTEIERLGGGKDSAMYKNYILGEFAEQEEDALIPLAWVEAAQDRWGPLQAALAGTTPPLTAVAADIARSGTNETVIASRAGLAILDLMARVKQDTMVTTGEIAAIQRNHGGVAVVDVVGLGAGVVDRLREQGQQVLAFNAGARAEIRGKPITDESGELQFVNLRSAGWWHLRDLLNPAYGYPVALPKVARLVSDLTAPKWRHLSTGKIAVESKDDIEKRLKRSTDHGDAVMQAFALEWLQAPIVRQGPPIGIGKHWSGDLDNDEEGTMDREAGDIDL